MAMYEDPFGGVEDANRARRRRPPVDGLPQPVQTSPFATAAMSSAQPRGYGRTDPNRPPDPPSPPADTNTGGGQAPPPPAPPDPPEAPPPYVSETSYNMRGFDPFKLNDPNAGDSERYQIGRVMRRHDPRRGVTSDLLSQLNQLGIAEFYGSGGNLGVRNTRNDPRFGRGGVSDVVYALDAQNDDTAWQPWFVDEGGASSDPTLNSLLANLGGFGYAQGGNGIAGQQDFMEMMRQLLEQGRARQPISAPPYQVPASGPMPASGSIPPEFGGYGRSTPGQVPTFGGVNTSQATDTPPAVSNALRLLAMRLPELQQQGGANPDALMAEIMRLVAPGRA